MIPQFNSHWFLSQLFWFCMVFLSSFLILDKFYFPRMKSVIRSRKLKRIELEENIDKLQKASKQISEELDYYKEKVDNVFNKALERIRVDIKKKYDCKATELEKSHQVLIKDTDLKISKWKADFINEFKAKSKDLIEEIINKIC
ncbi:hypothetical protein [Candidatus Nesciobacter abundans]|uniref:ATP synthase YMF19-like N-terminal domain-containing protein n=1 Tax=Candidatus Nesciobacter abundans TaxID=2601668 RepID=A0A5C0UGE2_9PROT|nr:hypothetical protein [Candidatus Nesciobacter abundans]QEK38879.1 hypothetical protein FZC36_00290 [Candidatus Nesciobacter abundans]